jgi:hypothetical protein
MVLLQIVHQGQCCAFMLDHKFPAYRVTQGHKARGGLARKYRGGLRLPGPDGAASSHGVIVHVRLGTD